MKNYVIQERLARGASSEVYKAREEATGKIVAVKIVNIDPAGIASREVLEKQKTILKRLQHKNIARLEDIIQNEDGTAWVVMDYIEGESLQELIRKRASFPFSRRVDIVLQCAEGLRAAYRQNVIHRDIKPANIMVAPDGTVKIIDFGLGKIFREGGAESSGTIQPPPHMGGNSETGARIAGTPRYMSPEQCLGRPTDHRSDIYSLGATFYHCLAGKSPFEAATPKELMEKHKSAPLEPLYLHHPGVPDDVSDIIQKMMEKDLTRRFQDYDHLIEALREVKLGCLSRERRNGCVEKDSDLFTVHEDERTLPSPVSFPMEKRSRKRSVFIIGMGAIVVILAFLILLFYRPDGKKVRKTRHILIRVMDRIVRLSDTPPIDKKKDTPVDERSITRNKILNVFKAMRRFEKDKGYSPKGIQELIDDQYLTGEQATDSWGERLLLVPGEKKVISFGPDRQEDTFDDIVTVFLESHESENQSI